MSAPAQHEPLLDARPRRVRRSWSGAAGVALLVAALVSVVAWQRSESARGVGASTPGRDGRDGADHAKPPSVRVVQLVARPFSEVLEGLGTVTPLATVTVRPQVDGPLLSVAFQEGASVHRGQLLAEIDPRPYRIRLAQARATAARDRAQLKNAELDLARYVSLSEQKLIARQQLDAQQSLVDQLEASVAADEADVSEAQLQLQYTRMTSPIDGVAGIRQVDPGNLVHAADTNGIVVLTQLDPIAVIFGLPQDQLPPLSAAMALAPPQVEAWSRDGSQQLAVGSLQVIDNQINAATASVRLKARFDNPERKLWPNQFVRARVTIAQRQSALVLPAAAVQHGPEGAYVYVVTQQDRAVLRPVTVGLLQGEQALIDRGVEAGERVVIQGQEQIKPGGRVRPVAASASAAAEPGRAKEAPSRAAAGGATSAP